MKEITYTLHKIGTDMVQLVLVSGKMEIMFYFPSKELKYFKEILSNFVNKSYCLGENINIDVQADSHLEEKIMNVEFMVEPILFTITSSPDRFKYMAETVEKMYNEGRVGWITL